MTLLSHRHPALYALAVGVYRLTRRSRWAIDDLCGRHYASIQRPPLPVRVKQHSSRSIRTLGDTPLWMQHNKVQNLAVALPSMNGLVIAPGETFSFWRRVGRPTRARGYVEGMQITRGMVGAAIGGGLCQLASTIHWLALHSPLTVVDRSHHSIDLFPDNQRSIPYGTGCSVFYNYVDFQIENRTEHTFQLGLELSAHFLEAELRADRQLPHSYTIVETDHAFVRRGDRYYRQNTLWKRAHDRRTGRAIADELVQRNFVRVAYTPSTAGSIAA